MNVRSPSVRNPKKLHLGCGAKYIPGFFHIDVGSFEHLDVRGAVNNLEFIRDNTVELIYAAHVLEHFGRHEVRGVLSEWYRVLAPHGVLRLAVPDFSAVATLYVAGRLTAGLHDILGLLVGGQRDQFDYHKMVFDQATLDALLKAVGFRSVQPWDWRETEHSQIDDYSQAYLPHMDKAAGTLVSLNLEATK